MVSICEYTISNKGGLPCHCLGEQKANNSGGRRFRLGRGGGGGGGGGELFVCFWPKVALQLSLSCEEFPVLSTI